MKIKIKIPTVSYEEKEVELIEVNGYDSRPEGIFTNNDEDDYSRISLEENATEGFNVNSPAPIA